MQLNVLSTRFPGVMLSMLAAATLLNCGDGTAVSVAPSTNSEQANLTANTCDLSGTWGIKFTIPVKWTSSLVVNAGEGEVRQWIKATRKHEGNTITDTMSLCGIYSPDSQTRPFFGSELYGVQFPDALFDSGTLTPFASTTLLQGDVPGGTFTIQPLTVLIGLQMENAALASWPETAAMTTIDEDHDGFPGITVGTRDMDGHKPPPVDMWRRHRASKFYIALRNVVETAVGTFSDCDHGDGTVTIPMIDGKIAINSRVLGCLRNDGTPCTPQEFSMVDKQSSGFNLNGASHVHMERMPDDVTCATIRGM